MTHQVYQDRAFHYGDGLFTTMLVERGRVSLWRYHQTRLAHDSYRLGLVLDMETLTSQVVDAARELGNGVLKLHISSGVGGRGYARPEKPDIQYRLSEHPVPAHYENWRNQGITAEISPVKLGLQPLLAGVKHLNRLEQVLIKRQMRCDDAIVCDIHNHLIEGSASNLFWMTDGQWVTPALDQCGVAGVYRAFILDVLNASGQPAVTGHFDVASLEHASAVFLCNTLMGIVPVSAVENKSVVTRFDINPVSDLQKTIKAAYERENEATD